MVRIATRETEMLKRTLFLTVILAVFTSAQAAEPLERGGYIGGGGGTSMFDDDGALSGLSVDDTDTSLMLFGGYKFFKYLSVEGRYTSFGTFDVEGFDLDASAVSVHVVGIVPFGTSGWELFGQLGLGTVNLEFEDDEDEDETAAAAGIGVRFSPSPNFAIGIQTDVFVWEEDDFGSTYDIAVGGTALTARFLF